jgi:hypothetical protein
MVSWNGLPVFSHSSRISSSPRDSIASAIRSSARLRSAGVASRQPGTRRRAARQAASTSSAPDRGAVAKTFPVDGSTSSMVSPEAAERSSPPIRFLVSRTSWLPRRLTPATLRRADRCRRTRTPRPARARWTPGERRVRLGHTSNARYPSRASVERSDVGRARRMRPPGVRGVRVRPNEESWRGRRTGADGPADRRRLGGPRRDLVVLAPGPASELSRRRVAPGRRGPGRRPRAGAPHPPAPTNARRVLDRTARPARRDREHLARTIARRRPSRSAAAGRGRPGGGTLRFSAAEARTLGTARPADGRPPGGDRAAGSCGASRSASSPPSPRSTSRSTSWPTSSARRSPPAARWSQAREKHPAVGGRAGERLLEAGLPAGGCGRDRRRPRGRRAPRGATRASPRSASPGRRPVGCTRSRRAPARRVLLELGSAAPLVVERDADVDAVVDAWPPTPSGTRGSRASRSSGCWCTRTSPTPCSSGWSHGSGRCVVGDPLEPTPTCRASSTSRRPRVSGRGSTQRSTGAPLLVGAGAATARSSNPRSWSTSEPDAPAVDRGGVRAGRRVRTFDHLRRGLAAVAAGPT